MNSALPPDEFIECAHRSSRLALQPPAIVRVVEEVLNSSAIFRSRTGLAGMDGMLLRVLSGTGLLDVTSTVPKAIVLENYKQQPLTIQEMVQSLNRRGLSVSNLAAVFGVSRPTVYSWMEGNFPQSEKQARVEFINNLVSVFSDQHLRLLPKAWLRKPNENIPSIYQILTAEKIDANAFDAAVEVTMPLLYKLAKRLEQPRKPTSTLVEETLAFGDHRIPEWDAMPDVGKEWPSGESV